MKKFKRKSKSPSVESQNKKTVLKFNDKKIKQYIYVITAIILIIVIFGIGFAYKRQVISNQYNFQAAGEVKIIDGSGQPQPNVPVGEEKADSVHSPINPESPATIEDLGGNKSNPTNIDQLLEDKNIEVNK